MMNRSKKVVFLVGALVAILVLSGCGLNERNAATAPPVVVETRTDQSVDPNNVQAGGEQTGGEAADNGGATDANNAGGGTNTDPNQSNDGGTTDPNQSTDNGDNQNTDNADTGNEQAAETPREEQPAATEVPVEPAPTEVPAAQPTAVPVPAAGGKHTVLAGQTLFSIAQSYGLTTQELAAANGIVNVNILSVGEELVIPTPGSVVVPQTATVHTVAYGDTLFNIAQRYGLTVEQIALHNNLSNINRIDIGQQIKIPTN